MPNAKSTPLQKARRRYEDERPARDRVNTTLSSAERVRLDAGKLDGEADATALKRLAGIADPD